MGTSSLEPCYSTILVRLCYYATYYYTFLTDALTPLPMPLPQASAIMGTASLDQYGDSDPTWETDTRAVLDALALRYRLPALPCIVQLGQHTQVLG